MRTRIRIIPPNYNVMKVGSCQNKKKKANSPVSDKQEPTIVIASRRPTMDLRNVVLCNIDICNFFVCDVCCHSCRTPTPDQSNP